MLFQVNVPAPKVIQPDSLRQATRDIVYQIQNEPDVFWHNLMDSAILFGVKVLAALLIAMLCLFYYDEPLRKKLNKKKSNT